MSRVNYRILIIYFAVYVILQIPLLYKFILFNQAYGFFYLGFLLFLPFGLNPFLRIGSGFLIGLLIDTFSNTPGLHASACTFLMFIRDWWFLIIKGDPEDDPNISIFTLGITGAIYYMVPLILIHHLWVFGIEHGKWEYFLRVLWTSITSAIFTFICITILNFVMARKPTRM